MEPPNPSGLCQCGCGETTGRSLFSDKKRGYIKGEHVRFVPGHHRRSPEARQQSRELIYANFFIHGEGHGTTPTYRSWRAMNARCYYPKTNGYHRYGGRGITVCDEWRHEYLPFREYMGERPPGKTLDRIDPDGNYEPGNCRWATYAEQRANQSKVRSEGKL